MIDIYVCGAVRRLVGLVEVGWFEHVLKVRAWV